MVCEATDLDSRSSEVKRRIIWRGISQNTTLASESANLEGPRGQAGTHNLGGKRPFSFSSNYWSYNLTAYISKLLSFFWLILFNGNKKSMFHSFMI